MIKKFSIDPARVERLTSRQDALFEVARDAQRERNEASAALKALEDRHRLSRETMRRWIAPPSEMLKLAQLKAELEAAKVRADATHADAQAYGRIASAVTEYAQPRATSWRDAMKGFSHGR